MPIYRSSSGERYVARRRQRNVKINVAIHADGDVGSSKPVTAEACMGSTSKRAQCGTGRGRTVKQAVANALKDLIKSRLR